MRTYGYYLLHSFVNVIKKMLKTWLAFFFIVMLLGCGLGFVIGSVASKVEDNISTEESIGDDESEAEEDSGKPGVSELLGKLKLEKDETVEIAVSLAFLLFLLMVLLTSKGTADMFLPADAALLFQSPLRPQSILIFRLFTTLGMQFIISIFMIGEVPNLTYNAGLSGWCSWTIVIAYIILMVLVSLLPVLLYLLSSYSEFFKRNMKIVSGGIIGLIAVFYIINVMTHERNLLRAAVATFTGSASRWIPFWGWTRGMVMKAYEGNIPMSIVYLALNIGGIAAMIIAIINIKADFYEDALISAEKRAALVEKSKKSNIGVATDKKRSEKIQRDGFNKGRGANVFFHKAMYNRMRFGVFKGITKTQLTYLAVSIFMVVLSSIANVKYAFLIFCGVLILIGFYRTMGNPLQEDINKQFFMMIPSSAREKLFWSLLGGMVNSLLDLVVPFAIAAVFFKVSPLEALLWLVFILTIDIYGTVVGTFIITSVSVNVPETVQTMIKVVFIYFGIFPGIIFLIVGIMLNNVAMMLPFGILLNLGISFLFFMLSAMFIQNGRR